MISYHIISHYPNWGSMHELTVRELYQALEYAKSIDEDAGSKIME